MRSRRERLNRTNDAVAANCQLYTRQTDGVHTSTAAVEGLTLSSVPAGLILDYIISPSGLIPNYIVSLEKN